MEAGRVAPRTAAKVDCDPGRHPQSLGSRLITYADDLVILCRRGKAEKALQSLREIMGNCAGSPPKCTVTALSASLFAVTLLTEIGEALISAGRGPPSHGARKYRSCLDGAPSLRVALKLL
jgi:hypothetical protein